MLSNLPAVAGSSTLSSLFEGPVREREEKEFIKARRLTWYIPQTDKKTENRQTHR